MLTDDLGERQLAAAAKTEELAYAALEVAQSLVGIGGPIRGSQFDFPPEIECAFDVITEAPVDWAETAARFGAVVPADPGRALC